MLARHDIQNNWVQSVSQRPSRSRGTEDVQVNAQIRNESAFVKATAQVGGDKEVSLLTGVLLKSIRDCRAGESVNAAGKTMRIRQVGHRTG